MVGMIVLVASIILLLVRVPISMSILIPSAIVIAVFFNVPLVAIPQYLVIGVNNFSVLAIPFFILAAEIMNEGGLTEAIFRFALACVGWITGGLAQVSVLASLIFSGMTGTAIGDAAGVGRVEIQAMQVAGYDKRFASAVVIVSCLLGPLVPPSIPLVVYAITANVSVGKMLVAGIIPALALTACMMLFIYVIAKSGKSVCPVVAFPGRRAFCKAFWRGLPALLAPVVILSAMFSGFLTTSEAGIAACAYSFVVGVFVQRQLTLRKFMAAVRRATLSTGMIMFLLSTSTVLSWIVTREQIGVQAAHWLLSISDSRVVQMLLINAFLIVVGALLEGLPALIILIPVIVPIASTMGIDPIQTGVMLEFSLLVGILLPPHGLGLFVMSDLSGLSVQAVFRACIPFYIPILAVLGLITFVPAACLTIPNLLFK
jgi:tripartite ATP-independent transporter DctM subunit